MKRTVDMDAWADAQVASKIWLCEELENHISGFVSPKIFILGGWYGQTAFLLGCRNKLQFEWIRSFDIDPECEPIADDVNSHLLLQHWRFKAVTADCNNYNYFLQMYDQYKPTVVINTAVEHFEEDTWWEIIPLGTAVALQGTDMVIVDHVNRIESIYHLKHKYKMGSPIYEGQKSFTYPDKAFTRYMTIGIK